MTVATACTTNKDFYIALLSKEPEVEALPVPVVEDLLMCQEYLQEEEPLTWLRQQLIVSPEKVIQTAF